MSVTTKLNNYELQNKLMIVNPTKWEGFLSHLLGGQVDHSDSFLFNEKISKIVFPSITAYKIFCLLTDRKHLIKNRGGLFGYYCVYLQLGLDFWIDSDEKDVRNLPFRFRFECQNLGIYITLGTDPIYFHTLTCDSLMVEDKLPFFEKIALILCGGFEELTVFHCDRWDSKILFFPNPESRDFYRFLFPDRKYYVGEEF